MQHAAERSQVLMRVRVDHLPATLTLHDGEQLETMMFVPPAERIEDQLSAGSPFVPVRHGHAIRLVARATIACIRVFGAPVVSNDLPEVSQRAKVRLRSGGAIEGELRWTELAGKCRTADHLNDATPHLVIFGAGTIDYIAKTHVAWVEEV